MEQEKIVLLDSSCLISLAKLLILVILGFICTVFKVAPNLWADEATHFQYHKSLNSVFFWGSVKVNGIDAEVGDELGIFDPNVEVNDGCIGAAVITTKGYYQGTPAYEDDRVTPEKDGAISGDTLTFKLWKANENKCCELDANGPDEPVWTTNLDVRHVNLITRPEVCDGVDNDCDGVVDNGDFAQYTGTDEGACQKGIMNCVGGQMVQTQQEIGPSTEVCHDNVDNDCDGGVDNGDCGGGGPCFIFSLQLNRRRNLCIPKD